MYSKIICALLKNSIKPKSLSMIILSPLRGVTTYLIYHCTQQCIVPRQIDFTKQENGTLCVNLSLSYLIILLLNKGCFFSLCRLSVEKTLNKRKCILK